MNIPFGQFYFHGHKSCQRANVQLKPCVMIFLLSRVLLIEAYPWVSLATVAVPILGWPFYGAQADWLFWVGLVFIMVGILRTQLGVKY